jgi:hypothetical protein
MQSALVIVAVLKTKDEERIMVLVMNVYELRFRIG